MATGLLVVFVRFLHVFKVGSSLEQKYFFMLREVLRGKTLTFWIGSEKDELPGKPTLLENKTTRHDYKTRPCTELDKQTLLQLCNPYNEWCFGILCN